MQQNLTTGSVWKTVVRFSLPYLLSYFLQTLYGMAEYLDLKPETVKKRLRAVGGYWIDGEQVGRKEPGSAG